MLCLMKKRTTALHVGKVAKTSDSLPVAYSILLFQFVRSFYSRHNPWKKLKEQERRVNYIKFLL